jgi:hypothetical protein
MKEMRDVRKKGCKIGVMKEWSKGSKEGGKDGKKKGGKFTKSFLSINDNSIY